MVKKNENEKQRCSESQTEQLFYFIGSSSHINLYTPGYLRVLWGCLDSLSQNELKKNSQKPLPVLPGNGLRASELST